MGKPNFFIVGAPKCGTTSLSEYLRNHPRAFVSNPKEPFYFCSDMPGLGNLSNEAEYLDLFRSAKSRHLAIGEASAVYMYSGLAAERIHAFDPSARIIAMLRDPMELLPSYHSQQLFALNEDEPDFARGWQLQEQRAAGNVIPPTCRNANLLQYRSLGMLGEQVERLLSVFPRNQILFVLFDDFCANTAKVYKEVLDFLKLPDDRRQSFPRWNPNKRYRFPAIRSIRRAIVMLPGLEDRIRRNADRLGMTGTLRALTGKPVPRERLSAEMHDVIQATFAEDVARLAVLIQRDLSHWMNPARAAA